MQRKKVVVDEPISLGELAKILKLSKSKLNYYAWLELVRPAAIIGKTMVFNKEEVIKRINYIGKEKLKGKTLKQLSEEFKNEDNKRTNS